ncbi:MAG TPA: HAD family hydrolase [Candidatus Saccharimonadales bacterium]|nr:HAD family hydrolase [Candidatus Saccharimonadales bacterium]
MRAVFLDRDGTINVGIPRIERVDSIEKVELLPGVQTALEQLAKLGYGVFFVTNQAGIAEGRLTPADFEAINNHILELIAASGIRVLKTYLCPHGEGSDCDCRKPKPKLLQDAAKEFDIDLASSWMVGDRPSDVMTGVNAGTKTILVRSGDPTAEAPEATFVANTLLDAIRYIANH